MFSKLTSHKYILTVALLTAPLYAADPQQQPQADTLSDFVEQSRIQVIDLARNYKSASSQGITHTKFDPIKLLNDIHKQLKIKFKNLNASLINSDENKRALAGLCMFADQNIMELALKYNNPNTVVDSNGNTLLMLSVYAGNYEATQVLLEKGADPCIINLKNESWADHAVKLRNELVTMQSKGPSAAGATDLLAAQILYAKTQYSDKNKDPFEACRTLVMQKQAALNSSAQ